MIRPQSRLPVHRLVGGIVSVKAENDAATNQAHNTRCHEPCEGQGGGHLSFGCRYPTPARHISIACCALYSVTRASCPISVVSLVSSDPLLRLAPFVTYPSATRCFCDLSPFRPVDAGPLPMMDVAVKNVRRIRGTFNIHLARNEQPPISRTTAKPNACAMPEDPSASPKGRHRECKYC